LQEFQLLSSQSSYSATGEATDCRSRCTVRQPGAFSPVGPARPVSWSRVGSFYPGAGVVRTVANCPGQNPRLGGSGGAEQRSLNSSDTWDVS